MCEERPKALHRYLLTRLNRLNTSPTPLHQPTNSPSASILTVSSAATIATTRSRSRHQSHDLTWLPFNRAVPCHRWAPNYGSLTGPQQYRPIKARRRPARRAIRVQGRRRGLHEYDCLGGANARFLYAHQQFFGQSRERRHKARRVVGSISIIALSTPLLLQWNICILLL